MKSYTDVGLTDKLKPVNSIAGRPSDFQNALAYNITQEPTPYLHRSSVMNRRGTVITNLGAIVDFKDTTGGTSLFTYNATTGAITLNAPVTFNGTTIFGAAYRGLFPEIYYELIDASYYTGNDNFEGVGPSGSQTQRTRIITSELGTANFDLYFEVTAGGDINSGLTAQLYNDTAGVAVANSTVSTVATSSGTPERLRSGTLALPTGTNEYLVQMKRTAGTGFPRVYGGRLITRLKGL